jgi:histidinol dehydrogenase
MKIYEKPPRNKWAKLCARPTLSSQDLEAVVKEVFRGTGDRKDEALIGFTERFDGVKLASVSISAEEVASRARKTPDKLKRAIDRAYDNIRKFHQAQLPDRKVAEEAVQTESGVTCWREMRAIDRVGLYVPGGSAPLVSTVLMLGIPAQLAGCGDVTLCTPPDPEGEVSPAICYAAIKVGVTRMVRVGGAQAIAALAIGTPSVPKADKIFGPGNQYVTAAKQYASAQYGTAIDMPAGPSEVLVIADEGANAAFVAADMLSQAEHGPDSQAVLLTDSLEQARKVREAVEDQLRTLPRFEIARQSIGSSICIVLDSAYEAVEFSNEYAPEHLILALRQPDRFTSRVRCAGSVFLGDYSPESAGDYASGTNHTLPTSGWARSYSGVSVEDFLKKITFQSLTRSGLENLAPTIISLAEAEGLEAHARAVSIRTEGS